MNFCLLLLSTCQSREFASVIPSPPKQKLLEEKLSLIRSSFLQSTLLHQGPSCRYTLGEVHLQGMACNWDFKLPLTMPTWSTIFSVRVPLRTWTTWPKCKHLFLPSAGSSTDADMEWRGGLNSHWTPLPDLPWWFCIWGWQEEPNWLDIHCLWQARTAGYNPRCILSTPETHFPIHLRMQAHLCPSPLLPVEMVSCLWH